MPDDPRSWSDTYHNASKTNGLPSFEGAAAHQERGGAGGTLGGCVSGEHRAEVQSGLLAGAPGAAGPTRAAPQPAGTLASTVALCVCLCESACVALGFGGIAESAAKQTTSSPTSLLATLDSILVQFRASVFEESGIWNLACQDTFHSTLEGNFLCRQPLLRMF